MRIVALLFSLILPQPGVALAKPGSLSKDTAHGSIAQHLLEHIRTTSATQTFKVAPTVTLLQHLLHNTPYPAQELEMCMRLLEQEIAAGDAAWRAYAQRIKTASLVSVVSWGLLYGLHVFSSPAQQGIASHYIPRDTSGDNPPPVRRPRSDMHTLFDTYGSSGEYTDTFDSWGFDTGSLRPRPVRDRAARYALAVSWATLSGCYALYQGYSWWHSPERAYYRACREIYRVLISQPLVLAGHN